METKIFGIRHHGPGSARSLLAALHAMKPDAVLIEGPPEAEILLPLLIHEETKPPIALLLYANDEPSLASFSRRPFFRRSGSIQLQLKMRCRFDSLICHNPFILPRPKSCARKNQRGGESDQQSDEQTDSIPTENEEQPDAQLHQDPLIWLAKAAGFADGESWWSTWLNCAARLAMFSPPFRKL